MFISHFAVLDVHVRINAGGPYTFFDYLSFGRAAVALFGFSAYFYYTRSHGKPPVQTSTAVAVCYAEQPAVPLGNGVFIVVVTDYCIEKGRRPPCVLR